MAETPLVSLNAFYIEEPDRKVDPAALLRLGVKTWRLDADKFENDPELEAIRKVRSNLLGGGDEVFVLFYSDSFCFLFPHIRRLSPSAHF